MTEQEWDTTTGLDDRFHATVSEAFFDEGDYGVQLVLVLDAPELGTELTKYFGCGKKAQLVSEDEVDCSALKGNTFHRNSAVGELIEALKADERLLSQVAGNGSPKLAKSWVGLEADWVNHQRSGTINGEKTTWDRLLPEAGEVEVPKEVEVPQWLITMCSECDTYDAFLSEALGDERLSADLRKVVLNESFWDFS
jgi:hypothetical protein